MSETGISLVLRQRVAELDGWTEITQGRENSLFGKHLLKKRKATADLFEVSPYEISFDIICKACDRRGLFFNLATTVGLDGMPFYSVHGVNTDPVELRIVGAGKTRAIAACRWFIAVMKGGSVAANLESLDHEFKSLSGEDSKRNVLELGGFL